ncbi:MAG: RNA pseudouridine synthase [Deltaproteobacteria bacterium]|nr:RNA pseudouridine synthase [Deltaproteobacteria bacterium]
MTTVSRGVEARSLCGTIVWQNDALVLVDKRPCILTVPGRQGADDARPCLGRWLEGELGRRLWPIHRLDYEVSGAVLFALNPQAHRIASVAFESRTVHKIYHAFTRFSEAALPSGDVQTWESLLVRGKRRSFVAPHGQLARTQARYIRRVFATEAGIFGASGDVALWELKPETGRAHQLRVHLANAGFPIAGDVLYGGAAASEGTAGIALRAVSLAFADAKVCQLLGVPTSFELASLFAP